ncbi:MAG: FAD-dependent oxidoreductase [Desulfobacteraceae bacterium]|nr:FAD-dependent oxidoreductase [Desulfobacteraceae bacterium]
MMTDHKRILIVGGVAGGASCAARLRRLCESVQIIMFDRGPYVSFANCGLAYYVGDVIKKEENLLIATPELFRQRFNIEVRLKSEVTAIDRDRRCIQVRDLAKATTYTERYDELVLSPGALPLRPDLAGIDLPGIFSLRTIPDSRMLRNWIQDCQAASAVVIGGGYIGMEITENLVRRGLKVSVIERENQVMSVADPEIVTNIHTSLIRQGVDLCLNESVTGFEPDKNHILKVNLASGRQIKTGLVVLCIGVQPETQLAREAGLEIGESGGIRVTSEMRTNDSKIFAVGDAIEVRDVVTGQDSLIALAGPANRQGRIAADVINGRTSTFRGAQATSVVGILDQVLAFTGPSENRLKRLGLWGRMEKIYLHPGHHAAYYPGSSPITIKLIFSKDDGRIVSFQAVGKAGVEKRVDVIAMAIQKRATVFDLEEAELCYAPQFGSAKDPVNVAGMIAANVMRGDVALAHWEDITGTSSLIVDVRNPSEYKKDHVKGALNLPLDQLRGRMGELPKNREILFYCFVGQRSYYAARALGQYGFKVKNISGGFKTYLLHKEAQSLR